MKNIFCRGFMSLFTLVAAATSFAQTKPLKIGENLPENVWSTPLQLVNHPQKTITLNQDKDKLILLDFWATWCSSCLLNFPKMEELQKQFGDKIKILAVSNQDRLVLEKFFASKNGQRYDKSFRSRRQNVSSALSTQRRSLYHLDKRRKTTQYYRWRTGYRKDHTGSIRRRKFFLQTVVQMSRDRPLMLSENFDNEKDLSMISYSLFAKGRIRGMGFGSGFHRSGQIVYGRQFTNFSFWEIASAIANEIFQKQNQSFNEKRQIIEFKNPERRVEDKSLYNYEYIVPQSKADSLYPLMLENLSRFADYKTIIEKRKVKCLVLKRTSTVDKLKTKGSEMTFLFSLSKTNLQNTSLYALVNSLNAVPTISLPIVDETGYPNNIDLKMGAISDLNSIRKELLRYDLDLVEAERDTDKW
jgi:thiol-disulfide isomerase/thioredoxin